MNPNPSTRLKSRSFVTQPFQVPLAAHEDAKIMYKNDDGNDDALEDLGDLGANDEVEGV